MKNGRGIPHEFSGVFISEAAFCAHRPLDPLLRPEDKEAPLAKELLDRHILFRRRVCLSAEELMGGAILHLTADDHYKLYINGQYVTEGPAPSYHFAYAYNSLDVTSYLHEGDNLIAVHTLYQGLVNRVWQSGDLRHGLLFDLVVGGRTVAASDGRVRVAYHSGYRPIGRVGYDTAFLEEYDAAAPEVGFADPAYDDSGWAYATPVPQDDHTLVPQKTECLVTEDIQPCVIRREGERLLLDFGRVYVGRLQFTAYGSRGDCVRVLLAQECEGGHARERMRAGGRHEERMRLAEGASVYAPFDYTAFRYAELTLPQDCRIEDCRLQARHYPFTLRAAPSEAAKEDPRLLAILSLCVHTQKYGVQEAVLDCMEREKGFYVGDGCYTALTHAILTGEDVMIRKLLDDAFLTARLCPTLLTCLNCSHRQEIAEYPLMLLPLILWHYRLFSDRDYLAACYPRAVALLEAYRTAYERDLLLTDLDKWCVVEWPANYRDGYEVPREGEICREPHVAISAYYLFAIETLNRIAVLLGKEPYRDTRALRKAFYDRFYDGERHLFRDSGATENTSLIGNILPFAFGLLPEEACRERILALIGERGITGVALFGAFPLLMGLVRHGCADRIPALLSDERAWGRMLDEGATATFEAWGREEKWNTSLFHLTFSYAAVFLTDTDLAALFD